MDAQIISIGNELLIGDTVNTNASWLGDYLTGIGFNVTRITTIPDDADSITTSLRQGLSEAQLVIITGGLGPTHDDITKKTVADYFGVDMRLDEDVLEYIKKIFERRNIPFSESNHEQARVPENCEVLFNKAGTAPGMWFDTGGSGLAVLPGVPYEMKYLVREHLSEVLAEKYGSAGYRYSRYIKTAGIGESTLSDEVIGDVSDHLKNGLSMAYLPAAGGVVLRLSAWGEDEEQAMKKTETLADVIYERAGAFIYGEGKENSLEQELGHLLRDKGLMISVAESCTGGAVSNSLTDIPGSSAYVAGGVISYSNRSKVELLGVSEASIEDYGAVSKEVALQMARGVAERLNADLGLSTTGVAGPGGGSPEKPVGTVWMGYWSENEHFAIKAEFTKDRLINKERSRMTLLEMCRRVLKGQQTMPYDLKKEFP